MLDVITISKQELQELIAKEVANRITPTKQRKDFGAVAIRCEDLELANRAHPAIYEKMKLPFYNDFSDDVMPLRDTKKWDSNVGHTNGTYSNKKFFGSTGQGAYYHSKRSLHATNIHELLKGLTLALYGGTVINDLTDDDFDEALQSYNDFKHFFLERYSVRLSKIDNE
ncbi:TPA: hypothetical protein U1D20_001050 [Streptococcus suis]|nr:hypothetical protein [Streptococcus suis]